MNISNQFSILQQKQIIVNISYGFHGQKEVYVLRKPGLFEEDDFSYCVFCMKKDNGNGTGDEVTHPLSLY